MIRKCSSIATTGVTNVCNWGIDDNGDYWQECSCSEDGCNGATIANKFSILFLSLIILPITFYIR